MLLQNSAVLSTFPWNTDFLIELDKNVVGDMWLTPFFKALEDFNAVLEQPYNADASDLRQALSIVGTNATEMPSTMATVGRPTRLQLCHVLCMYRLVDVLHWVTKTPTSSRNPRYPRLSSIGVTSQQRNWPIVDWVLNLKTGRELFFSIYDADISWDNPESTNFRSPHGSADPNIRIKLFCDLYNLDKKAKGFKMLFNIQLAALHLSFLLSGYSNGALLSLPDLPLGTEHEQPAFNIEQATLYAKALLTEYQPFKLRYPLYASLLFSPLVLLTDKMILSRCMDHEEMVKVSKALGNCKPTLLMEMESNLWATLLDIATGQVTTQTAVHRFFWNIDWAKVETVSKMEQDFFVIDTVPRQSPLCLLSMEGETNINDAWPLANLRKKNNDHAESPGVSSTLDNSSLTRAASPHFADTHTIEGNAAGLEMVENVSLGSDVMMSRLADKGGSGPSGNGHDKDDIMYERDPDPVAHLQNDGPDEPMDREDNEQGPDPVAHLQNDGPDEPMDREDNEQGPDPVAQLRNDDEPMDNEDNGGGISGLVADARNNIDDEREAVSLNRDANSEDVNMDGLEVRRPDSTPASNNGDSEPRRSTRMSNKARSPHLHTQQVVSKKKQSQPRTTKPSGSALKYLQQWGGTYLEPIDLDIYMEELEVTFQAENQRHRILSSQCRLFSPSGEQHLFVPEFHFQSDLIGFNSFYSCVEQCLVDGKPCHSSVPERSFIQVMSYNQYNELSAKEIQHILRAKHIIVTDMPTEAINFDAQGFVQSSKCYRMLTISVDQSIEVKDNDFSKQHCIGTLQHVLDASEAECGPILNALSFPLSLSGVGGIGDAPFGTEIEAWHMTAGLPFCQPDIDYPTGDMRWGLAGTRGARHWVHIDSDGLGTFIDVKCGGKWWILFSPSENQDKYGFASIDQFLDDFDTSRPDGGRLDPNDHRRWFAEAVLLTPGTRLIMRPNTPHAVFTTDHSIVMGGHFYSTSNLQDTFFGIVHCFIGDSVVTNVDHCKTRRLLLRIMQYFYKYFITNPGSHGATPGHIPNLLEEASFIDVLTLCNFCCLLNVLDFRTYSFPTLSEDEKPSLRDLDQNQQWDYNALSVINREYFTYVRGLARNFIKWLGCNYEVVFLQSESPVADFERDVAGRYLIKQALALLNYKSQAETQGLVGAKHSTFESVERQLDLLFAEGMSELGDWASSKVNFREQTSLAFGDMTFSLRKRSNPPAFKGSDPMQLGRTKGDKMYKRGCAFGFPSSKSNVRMLILEDDESVSEEEGSSQDEEDFNATRNLRSCKRKRTSG